MRSGQSKSDVIDAEVLTRASEVFDLTPLTLPTPAQFGVTSIGDPTCRRSD
ncbi:transposase [Mycobacterium tuberculosis SUMu006]|nr:transposase [Mycobacterium tuberculosis SUMu006]